MWMLWLACQPEPQDPLAATRDPAEALRLVQQIDDPIVRGARANEWVQQRRGDTPTPALLAICDALEHPERGVCRRRLESAHLE